VGVGLAMNNGRCLNAVQFSRRVHVHPDTKQVLGGISIPNWRELLHLAARCYDMTDLGYIGADLVLDKHLGPQLLELNARPGLAIQIANGQGLLPRLRKIEAIREKRKITVEQRTDYVMREFANPINPISV